MAITCKIVLDDNPKKIVFSGQRISGTIHLSLTEETTVRGVKLHIHGKSTVEAKFGNTTYTLTQDILNSEEYFVGSSDGRIQLTTGVHSFTFQYLLPPNIPSTMYEKSYFKAFTSYGIRVVVDIPFWKDRKFNTPLTVIRPRKLDLLQILRPLTVTANKKFNLNCLLCCYTSEPLEIVARSPLRGYCPNGTIFLELDVKNSSHLAVTKFTIKLIKEFTGFYTKDLVSSGVGHTVISKQETRGCKSNENEKIEVNITVPLTSPTEVSTIIKVNYFIQIIGHVSFWHFNPELRIPIEIGTHAST